MEGPPDIEALYARFSPLVVRRARRFFGTDEAPEELVQDVFASLVKDPSPLEGSLRPSSALFRAATRLCLARVTKNLRRKRLVVASKGEGGWLEAAGSADEPAALWLRTNWRSLWPELLEIAVYSEVDGMAAAQIADLTGVSRERVIELLDELLALVRSP